MSNEAIPYRSKSQEKLEIWSIVVFFLQAFSYSTLFYLLTEKYVGMLSVSVVLSIGGFCFGAFIYFSSFFLGGQLSKR